MRISVFAILLSLFGTQVHSQHPLAKIWDKRFGGSVSEDFKSFQQTYDGGYILGGSSSSGASGDKSEASWTSWDYWVVKIDSNGTKVWDKRFGGTNEDRLSALWQNADGTYVLGGSSLSGISGQKFQANRDVSMLTHDYWLVKIDSAGGILWEKRFGGAGEEQLTSLQQTFDGGYILGGYSLSDSSGDKTQGSQGQSDYWVVKIGPTGNYQWDKRFGGAGNERLNFLQQTVDSGILLGGISNSGITGDKSQDNRDSTLATYDYWVVKTDLSGNYQWDFRFGGSDNDKLYSFCQTADEGYILGGISSSDSSGDKTVRLSDTSTTAGPSDFWLVKIDSSGIYQWDKKYGGLNTEDDFGTVRQTADGGFLIAGTSYSGISGDKTEENLGREQTWMLKTDSAGNRLFDKTLFSSGNFDDESGFAIQTRDGCFALANCTSAGRGGDKSQPSRGGYDYWIAKLCDRNCNLSAINIEADTAEVCNGDSVEICAPQGFTGYLWSNWDSAICIQTTQAGVYAVTVTDINLCSAASNRDTILVHPLPFVFVTQVGDTLVSTLAFQYQWYRNDSLLAGDTSRVYIVRQEGTYFVVITDSIGCVKASNPRLILGIEKLDEDQVTVYPNPLPADNWEVTIGNYPADGILEIFDNEGSVLLKSQLHPRPGGTKFDLKHLAAKGLYLLRISSADRVLVRKLIRL